MNIVIEEFVNVDETFKNIKNIKVGTMVLNDLFGDNLKVIEKALEERKELLKWKDSQQDLIKGKDEYIAKLCNDRTELKEHEKELIKEQNRLFDLCKEQENELKKLQEFTRIVIEKDVDIIQVKCFTKVEDYNVGFDKEQQLTQAELDLLREVVVMYAK